MAFAKLAPYIDEIEQGLKDKKSPRTIAKELGQPGLDSTIQRYKTAVWNLRELVSDAKEVRALKHEACRNEAIDEIVNTLDVINLGKLRARQLLRLELGQDYTTAEGEPRKLSWGSAVIYWQAGQRMICDLSKTELDLSGDDGESRMADAMEAFEETRLAILEAVDDEPVAKEKIVNALLERRRRNSVQHGPYPEGAQ
ncbi:MAG: hypothetical protein WCG94_00395 [Methanothrix sp.]